MCVYFLLNSSFPLLCRVYRSEYNSNFKEPGRFDYVRGSWHGAAPPHVQIKGVSGFYIN